MIYNSNMSAEEIIKQSVEDSKQMYQKMRRKHIRRMLDYYGGNGTRQETDKGFPELIGKELQQWATDEYNKIKRRI